MKQLFQSSIISIIGGADGPTTIFVTPEYFKYLFVPLSLVILGFCIFSIAFFVKRKKKYSQNKKKLILPIFFLIISVGLLFLIFPFWVSFFYFLV